MTMFLTCFFVVVQSLVCLSTAVDGEVARKTFAGVASLSPSVSCDLTPSPTTRLTSRFLTRMNGAE